MEAGIREAVGLLSAVFAHQLYQRLQRSASPLAPPVRRGFAREVEDLDLFDDEEEPELEIEVPGPTCALVEGSASQRFLRQLSYCDDNWIWLHVAFLVLGPFFLWRLFLCCAGCYLRPLRTPRRNVTVIAPRARRPRLGSGPQQR